MYMVVGGAFGADAVLRLFDQEARVWTDARIELVRRPGKPASDMVIKRLAGNGERERRGGETKGNKFSYSLF
jgi:hypothetical protein